MAVPLPLAGFQSGYVPTLFSLPGHRMPIRVLCDCGQKIVASDHLARKKIKCPACNQLIRLPEMDQETAKSLGWNGTSDNGIELSEETQLLLARSSDSPPHTDEDWMALKQAEANAGASTTQRESRVDASVSSESRLFHDIFLAKLALPAWLVTSFVMLLLIGIQLFRSTKGQVSALVSQPGQSPIYESTVQQTKAPVFVVTREEIEMAFAEDGFLFQSGPKFDDGFFKRYSRSKDSSAFIIFSNSRDGVLNLGVSVPIDDLRRLPSLYRRAVAVLSKTKQEALWADRWYDIAVVSKAAQVPAALNFDPSEIPMTTIGAKMDTFQVSCFGGERGLVSIEFEFSPLPHD